MYGGSTISLGSTISPAGQTTDAKILVPHDVLLKWRIELFQCCLNRVGVFYSASRASNSCHISLSSLPIYFFFEKEPTVSVASCLGQELKGGKCPQETYARAPKYFQRKARQGGFAQRTLAKQPRSFSHSGRRRAGSVLPSPSLLLPQQHRRPPAHTAHSRH